MKKHRTWKQMSAGLLALTLTTGMASVLPASAKEDALHTAEEISAVLDQFSRQDLYGESESGDYPVAPYTSIYTVENPEFIPETPKPERFDLRDVDGKNYVSPVKLQNPYGTCWAFATTAAAEVSVAYQAGIDLNQVGVENAVDFSERHLAWFTAHPLPEGTFFQSQAGEGLICGAAEALREQENFSHKEYNELFFNTGGFTNFGTSVYSSYQGPVFEEDAPYRSDENLYDGTLLLVDFKEKPDKPLERSLAAIGSYGTITQYTYYSEEELQKLLTESGAFREDGSRKRINFNDLDWWEGAGTYVVAATGLALSADGTWDVDESLRFITAFQLEESNILPSPCNIGKNSAYQFDERGVNAIKNELLQGKAVTISYHADQSMPGDAITGSSFMSFIDQDGNPTEDDSEADYWCQYTFDPDYNPEDPQSINHAIAMNHAVTIVGYDDTIPKEYFHDPNGTLGGDGAFIVKNSWGEGWGSGGSGYFYLSYYDQSISLPESFSFRFITADQAAETKYSTTKTQMYDLMPTNAYNELVFDQETAMVNVFTADKDMMIHSVGYTSVSCNEHVTFEVYIPGENAKNPTDGELAGQAEAVYPYGGFHTTALDKPIAVRKGQTYAVKATVQREDGTYAAGIKTFLNLEGSNKVSELFAEKAEAAKEELEKAKADPETPAERIAELESLISRNADYADMYTKTIYANAVVNKGESLLCVGDTWTDWADILAETEQAEYSKYYEFDNFSIKTFSNGEIINVVNETAEPLKTCQAGDTVPCKITVQNPTKTDLENIDLYLDGEKLTEITSLKAGESTVVNYTHTVTAEEVKKGEFRTNVTATMLVGNSCMELHLMEDFSKTALTVSLTGEQAPTETQPAADYATPEDFARMSKIDYEKKYGVAVTPETVMNEDGTVTVTLKNADGKVLETYTLDAKTGIGKDSRDAEVNLPQTGITNPGTAAAAAGAATLTAAGLWLIHKAVRRKKEEE